MSAGQRSLLSECEIVVMVVVVVVIIHHCRRNQARVSSSR